jgi:hypothetical protein
MTDPGTPPDWHKSSSSATNGCVEVAHVHDGWTLVRNSRIREGATLAFSEREWKAFLKGVKAGEFDRHPRASRALDLDEVNPWAGQRLLRPAEAVPIARQVLGVAPRTFDNYRERGLIPFVRTPSGRYRYPEVALRGALAAIANRHAEQRAG